MVLGRGLLRDDPSQGLQIGTRVELYGAHLSTLRRKDV